MPKKTAHVLWFKDIRKTDIPLVGGKGANLGEMTYAKVPVPDGFVVTAKAYYDFLDSTSLRQKILTELAHLDVEDSKNSSRRQKILRRRSARQKCPRI